MAAGYVDSGAGPSAAYLRLSHTGHRVNLLVYGPGRYKFCYFVKVGTPLTLICPLIVVVITPLSLEKLIEVSARAVDVCIKCGQHDA